MEHGGTPAALQQRTQAIVAETQRARLALLEQANGEPKSRAQRLAQEGTLANDAAGFAVLAARPRPSAP